MATLKNTIINDTGYLKLPVGDSAQRPSGARIFNIESNWGVSVAYGVSATAGTNLASPLGYAVDGLQLFIGAGAWNRYQNLPNYLRGLLGTTSINDSDSCTFVFQNTGTVYMLRLPTWNAVDTTGWTTVETGRPYLTGGESVSVFSRTFTPGTYTFDNNSAMYFFDMQQPYTWVAPAGVTSIELLVVGGGGGGGYSFGGGGGGGGVYYQSSYAVTPGATYYVKVGAGGAGGADAVRTGFNGGNSSFSSSTAHNSGIVGYGGGGGGRDGGDPDNGLNGGCGGGTSIDGNARATSIQASFAGGGVGFGGGLGGRTYYTGGGGGGAGEAGQDQAAAGSAPDDPYLANNSGRGGDGYLSSITGTATYYAGGGGGGAGTQVHGRPGEPGLGGGGVGGTSANSGAYWGRNGVDGLGGGGGGGGQGYNGGDGGCGCVIIKYNTETAEVGMIRYNTEINNVEYRTAYDTWEPLQALPFKIRSILTVGYVMGGYKDSVAWHNVNRILNSTDTTTNLGDGSLERSFNYKSSACNLVNAFVWGAGNAHATNSNVTTVFNMRTETKTVGQNRFNLINSRGHMGTIFQEHYSAWIVGGENATIEEFNLTTETLISAFGSSFGGDAGASSGGPWGMSHENYGIWYMGADSQNFAFSTRTNSTRGASGGQQPGAHYQQKSLQSKLTNCYAGHEGSWSGGYNLRRTNMVTNTTSVPGITKGKANCGEENYTLGQDWMYCLGNYDGAQNNGSFKFTYATETSSPGGSTMEPKGKNGLSSAACAWRS